VTIVFTQGTQMGDTSVKQAIHKIRQESRKDIVTNLETKPDGKQWLPQTQNQREGD
jgi:D-mannonate dehydratase